MEKLIKPVDYANQMGISRQAVYAKIKKGILTSRNIGGKIFIVLDGSKDETHAQNKSSKYQKLNIDNNGQEKLLQAKDETISILRETIHDLKETNKMITSTLRGEVDLLKDAFSEMKMLYSMQIEHKTDNETIEVDTVMEDPEELSLEEDNAEWIELDELFVSYGINKSKKQKKIKKLFKKLFKKGDTRIDRYDGDIVYLAGADFSDIMKKL